MDKYTLLKPITFEEKQITELDYDFDSLDGSDLIKAEHEIDLSVVQLTPFTSLEYQAVVFAKAAKQPIELISKLKPKDFAEVTARTAAFLMV